MKSKFQLKPSEYAILCILKRRELHSYGIFSYAKRMYLPMNYGTLYRSLKNLVDAGFIEMFQKEHKKKIRNHFRLTDLGVQARLMESGWLRRLSELGAEDER